MKILDKYAKGGVTPDENGMVDGVFVPEKYRSHPTRTKRYLEAVKKHQRGETLNFDESRYLERVTTDDFNFTPEMRHLFRTNTMYQGALGDFKDGLTTGPSPNSGNNSVYQLKNLLRDNINIKVKTYYNPRTGKTTRSLTDNSGQVYHHITPGSELEKMLTPNLMQEHEDRVAENVKQRNLSKTESVEVGPITGGKVVEEPISIEPKKVTTVGDFSKPAELPKRPPIQEQTIDKPSTDVIEDSEISDDGIVNEKKPKPTPAPEQREEYVPQSQRQSKEYVPQSKRYKTGGVTDGEETIDDINKANKAPKKESGNYRGGSDIPQVVRDKDIDRNRGWGDGDSDVDGDGEDTSTTNDTQKTPKVKKTKDEKFDDRQARKQKRSEDRIERKRKREARRKYRKESRQYRKTMRRKGREERRALRGHDHVQGRRISPRRWWKNLKGKLTGRWYGEGNAKGYRDFSTARWAKPVREYKEGGVSGGNLSKSNKEINEFLKQNKAAKEMKDFRKVSEARKLDWDKIKQPKTATKKLTKSQIAKILAKKGGSCNKASSKEKS